MYYPYLRGRQFELLALRDFAESLHGEMSHIFPIIEPVRENKNALKKTAMVMAEQGMKFGIILNPENGDCAKQWLDFSQEQNFPPISIWSPVFIVRNNIKQILNTIRNNNYSSVILVIPKTASDSEDQIIDLICNETITKVIIDTQRRRIKQTTTNYHKDIIILSDNFEAKSANKCYLSIDEELFSEEFAYYKSDGYDGFSDYTVIPNEFREGGVLPNVVAIHLTYQKDIDQIYIKHFCSHSNINDKSNIQGKFSEAAKDAIAFYDIHSNENSLAIDILRNNIANMSFPGLGMIKKISIFHHLLLNQRILSK